MGPYAGVEYNNLTLSTPTHVPCQSRLYPYARVDLIPRQGLRIWLLALVPICKFWHIRNFAFYATTTTTKWVCCLHTGFDVGCKKHPLVDISYFLSTFQQKKCYKVYRIRMCRRVDYLEIIKQVPIIACCWRRKCLPRFSLNRAITSFFHCSTDILFTKIMIYLTLLLKTCICLTYNIY